VTLPNDPSNLARALVLLEQNQLLKLKPGIDRCAPARRTSSQPAQAQADPARSGAAATLAG
jgi:D-methionine transport system substrate-binding protein